MRNYLIGLIYGSVIAASGLGAASYLLPQRVQIAALTAPANVTAPPPATPEIPPSAEPTSAEPTSTEPTSTEPTGTEPPAKAPPVPEPPAQPPAQPLASEPAPAPAKDPAPASNSAPPAQPALSPEPAPLQPAPPEPAPQLGAKTQTPPSAAPAQELPPLAPAPAPPALPPLQAYAAPFGGSANKPLFAIVLIDNGNPDVDRAVAASLPFPVSFAVDPEADFAPVAMALYRAAGKEVIALPQSLPAGATASDVEASMAAYAALLPESVAVMSAPEAGFQDDRALAGLVLPAIAAQGRGALLMDKGLNTAAQIAQREAIPYALISKVIDSAGESVPVMRRYLDRAVFQAAQDGAAIVMGTAQPDTLAALTEWAVEGRASDVTLAPISALMAPPQ